MKIFKLQKGATLLESILALSIAGLIMVMTLKVYQSWRQEAYVQAVQYDINTLLVAMGNYYFANCGITGLGTNSPAYGALATASTSSSYVMTLSQLNGFLPSQWSPSANSIVSAYYLQFNPVVTTPVYSNCSANNCSPATPIALPGMSSLTWRVQVAALLNNNASAAMYASILGADCVSSGNPPAPCESNPAAGNVLIWERSPSMAAPSVTSNLWVSMPTLKQFNLQYTHDQMYESRLANTPSYIDNTYIDSSGNGSIQTYYLCGG